MAIALESKDSEINSNQNNTMKTPKNNNSIDQGCKIGCEASVDVDVHINQSNSNKKDTNGLKDLIKNNRHKVIHLTNE